MSAKKDLELYWDAMRNKNVSLALAIERKYGLDGYPPSVVTTALTAEAEGRDMYETIDNLMRG